MPDTSQTRPIEDLDVVNGNKRLRRVGREEKMADTHVWLVHTPIEMARTVEKASVVAIGWEQMGNLSTLKTREEIKHKYESVYSETGVKAGIGAGQLHRFAPRLLTSW